MKYRLAVTVSTMILVAASSPPSSPTALDVQPGVPVAMTINGEPVQILIDPDAPSMPLINPEHAERLKLKPSMMGVFWRVGPKTTSFWTDSVKIDAGIGVYTRRVGWSKESVRSQADGTMSPGSLTHDQVVIHLRPAAAGETNIIFPLNTRRWSQTGTVLMAGEAEIPVTFALTRRETLMTASTGALLSKQYGGYFSGEVRETMVRYGIVRPIRPLTVRTPLRLGRLNLTNLAVRTADNGNSAEIGDNAAPMTTEYGDDEEIVVTAKSKKNKASHGIIIGSDALSACSTITYDFRAKELRLSCL